MGKKMVGMVEYNTRSEYKPLSLQERYAARKQRDREHELPPDKTMGTAVGIKHDMQMMRNRLYTDPLYAENLEKNKLKKAQPVEEFHHVTTKHKPPTEARGSIINNMATVLKGPPLVSPRLLVEKSAAEQVQARKEQTHRAKPSTYLVGNRVWVDVQEKNVVISPLGQRKKNLFTSSPKKNVNMPVFNNQRNDY
eukprot:TRINITY_DN35202_c0_g1_i2.p1 TRINITY_DN35202_c0_g1~~TRINITY_DN35202_c0_g1_i2.p1  ORF type:complete len:194 (+),score=27.99 TRINITY_DN35202_c0_g1_i2:57-638(+)